MDKDAGTATIRVVVFQDAGLWVAQCLEYDIGVQAETIDSLRDRFEVALKAEFSESVARHGEPFAGIDPAPERFQRMWEHRARSIQVSPLGWPKDEHHPNLDLAIVA